ncbi:MAG: N-acetylmuramoyl-L-alanine amidase [Eubacterium sp.]|nr:N-acetylmuramoyl-L-alanine amidase [Eubacterium sp.]
MNREDYERILFYLFIYISTLVLAVSIRYGNRRNLEERQRKEAEAAAATASEASTQSEATTASQAPKVYRVVIDPGHGGNDTGAFFQSEEGRIHEKTVNFKVSKYLKKELEKYENIEVIMTRTKDIFLYPDERARFAIKHKADFFVSLHNNTLVGAGGYAEGFSIVVPMGNYKKKIGKAAQKLGCNIAYELSRVGLKNNGLLMRSSRDYKYENGRAADFYAVIRKLVKKDIPGVIIEHGFIDNENDFYDYLCTKEQLKRLAEADARAIARYLCLKRKDTGQVQAPLTNYKIKICHIKRSGAAKRFSRTYYKSK